MNQEKALHKQFFRIEIAILIGTFLIQALFIFYLHSLNLIIPYSDVISHLNIARRVIDDSYPGIAQLGNSWLPVTHIFYLPFIWNDSLWHSGLAGAIPSAISFAVTTVFIFRFAKEFYSSRLAGLAAAFILILNVNVMYLSAVPMMESAFVMFLTMSAYYFYHWTLSEKPRFLVYTGIATSFACLTRYEAWILPLAYLFLTFLILLVRRCNRRFIEGSLFLIIPWSFLGIGLWIVYLTATFRQPLIFMFGPFSAVKLGTYIHPESIWGYALRGHLLNDLRHMIFIYGSVFDFSIWFGSLIYAFICLFRQGKEKRASASISAVLLTPFLFHFIGINQGWGHGRFRAATLGSIFVALFFAGWIKFASKLPNMIKRRHKNTDLKRVGELIALFIIVSLCIRSFTNQFPIMDAPTLREYLPKKTSDIEYQSMNVGLWMRDHYEGGLILIDTRVGDPVIFYSGFSPKTFVESYDRNLWIEALSAPWRVTRYVVICIEPQYPGQDAIALRWLDTEYETLMNHYEVVYQNDRFMVLETEL